MRPGLIGIDVGGSKMLFELFDSALSPIDQIKVKTHGDNKKKFTETVLESLEALLKKSKQRSLKISAVGIGCAGTIDTARNLVKVSPNIPALKEYSFPSVLRKLVAAPVRIYNDVNAALYGELKCGAAAGLKHVIAVRSIKASVPTKFIKF